MNVDYTDINLLLKSIKIKISEGKMKFTVETEQETDGR